MNIKLAFAIFTGGIFLIILGFIANDSTSSDVSSLLFHGSANNHSIWLLLSGIAAVLAGLNGMSRRLKVTNRYFSKAADNRSEKNY